MFAFPLFVLNLACLPRVCIFTEGLRALLAAASPKVFTVFDLVTSNFRGELDSLVGLLEPPPPGKVDCVENFFPNFKSGDSDPSGFWDFPKLLLLKELVLKSRVEIGLRSTLRLDLWRAML